MQDCYPPSFTPEQRSELSLHYYVCPKYGSSYCALCAPALRIAGQNISCCVCFNFAFPHAVLGCGHLYCIQCMEKYQLSVHAPRYYIPCPQCKQIIMRKNHTPDLTYFTVQETAIEPKIFGAIRGILEEPNNFADFLSYSAHKELEAAFRAETVAKVNDLEAQIAHQKMELKKYQEDMDDSVVVITYEANENARRLRDHENRIAALETPFWRSIRTALRRFLDWLLPPPSSSTGA